MRHARSMHPEAAVVVDGLTKRYGAHTVVDDVSFAIAQGETFALLGPNGAGKSTTVEMLEGFRTPTSGTARVLGIDPQRGDRGWRSRIGLVLQSSGQAGVLTVREILTHFARVFPDVRDVDETIAAVGLTEHARPRVSKLSGGQQRRVDVALGIMGRPEVLFLDEPTTGFDPQARRALPASVVRGLRGEPVDLEIVRPSLEDIYLSMIGEVDDAEVELDQVAA